MSDARPQKKKQPFLTRLANRARKAKALGKVLVYEPGSFPSEVLKLIRRLLRTVWDARGGGPYACGFLIAFVFVDVRMFILEIVTADSIGSYFSGQVSDLLFKYVGQSFQNTISAFMWPVYVIELDPIWGAAILAAMFFLFPRILKEPLERWLFDSSDVDRPATTE